MCRLYVCLIVVCMIHGRIVHWADIIHNLREKKLNIDDRALELQNINLTINFKTCLL